MHMAVLHDPGRTLCAEVTHCQASPGNKNTRQTCKIGSRSGAAAPLPILPATANLVFNRVLLYVRQPDFAGHRNCSSASMDTASSSLWMRESRGLLISCTQSAILLHFEPQATVSGDGIACDPGLIDAIHNPPARTDSLQASIVWNANRRQLMAMKQQP